MTISKLRLAAPRPETVRALVVTLAAMAILETVRVVLFRTVLLDQPVAKVATLAALCTVLTKLIQYLVRSSGPVRVLRSAGFVFACAGSFVSWVPAMMVFGRPASAHTTPVELAFVVVGGVAGFVAFATISSRTWQRKTSAREMKLP